jgi:peptide subunit release factor 1 (eRF1)
MQLASLPDTPDQPTASLDGELERLLAFEPTTLPVLSVYLNTQPGPNGRDPQLEPYLRREFKALARTWPSGSSERTSFDADCEKILAYLDGKLDPAANGVAIFACSGAELFECIQMTAPVEEHRIYVYHQPHLFHLARIDDEYPRYAAVVMDANTARIHVFGLGQPLETEVVKGKKMHRVKVGGWSQARYQRRVENAQAAHAKEVVERLQRLVQEEKIAHIVIAGDPVIVPVFQQELPKDLADRIVDTIKLDIRASDQEVFQATLEKIREADSKTDAEKVQRLFEQYRGRGLAVAGPEAVLEALTNGQVDELLISASLEAARPAQEPVDAVVAPEIPDSSGGTGSDEPREASLPDLLVTKARQTSAQVSFIQDPALLERVEGVGAFLRWRT